jgi:hypothetical protein
LETKRKSISSLLRKGKENGPRTKGQTIYC